MKFPLLLLTNSRTVKSKLQRSLLIVERGAGVKPLRGGSAPTPLVHDQFVNAVQLIDLPLQVVEELQWDCFNRNRVNRLDHSVSVIISSRAEVS
jgi:hypothetical protein